MKLQRIKLEDLKTSPLNVRKHGDKTGGDLVHSIQANGLIQPLLVRPNCKGFEVVAGQRRLSALQEIAKAETLAPIPCLVMDDKDDAKAIEASLAENLDRLPMDEIDQYEAFSALKSQGRTIEDIAAHFGVTEKLVTQRLAIADLYDPILNAYRNDEINPQTLRLLTLASKRQQKDWYKLYKDDKAPPQWTLKSWLFGGDEIPTDNALFEPGDYKGAIISDLFGEDHYFADAALFWEYQSRAIAEIKLELEEEGWCEIVLLDVGKPWRKYEHVDTPQDKGGKVYIQVCSDGEVKVHKGLLPEKEAKRLALIEAGDAAPNTERPELTKSMQNYLAHHRHAAVRVELLKHQGIALRLCVAQIIASSSLWDVRADTQKANTDAIKDSLAASTAQAAFTQEKQRIMELLDIKGDEDSPIVCHMPCYGRGLGVHSLFAKLVKLKDAQVMKILTYLVAETLPSNSGFVEGLCALLNVDMAKHWKPEDTFLDLLRDKDAINAMLAEVGGKTIAEGNVTATAKVQKQIILDFLNGNGRETVENWQPRYMSVPMSAYTNRGGIEAIKQYKTVKQHYSA